MAERSAYWLRHAEKIHHTICARAWSSRRQSFVATFEGETLDASLLLLNRLGFLRIEDPRFKSTVATIEKELRHGDFIFRYTEADDFGAPDNAFLVCTFWYIDVLASMGRGAEARDLFEKLLACRNQHGLLAEHIDPRTRELWGNFPQTYSMVGLINAGMQLSIPWDQAF
jgi:GH15 family glucan-1,4-alpha-glucosidase